MVKRFFLLAAGAIALTACTSEEVVDDVATSKNVIQFENVVNKMTRATDLNTGNFKQFNVFGFYTTPGNAYHANQVFDNVTIVNDGSGTWKCKDPDHIRYWIPEAKYYFYAYSCGSAKLAEGKYGDFSLNTANTDDAGNELNLTAKDRVLEIDDYICDYTHQHDLIVASNTGVNFAGIVNDPANNSDVPLQFKHILTKLKAKFTSQFSPEYTVVIKNVSVRNILNYGDYNFTDGWKGVNKKDEEAPLVYLLNTIGDGPEGMTDEEKALITDKELSVQNKKDNNDQQASVETNTAYVIPFDYKSNYGKVYINLDIELFLGTDKVISKTLKATFEPEWKEGYSYVYNIELSAKDLELGTIAFSTTIDGWNTDREETLHIGDNTSSENNQ